MTKFILVRHGKPTYENVYTLGFKRNGANLAPLCEDGILEIKETCKNKIFKRADVLISSPYTRCMQTAGIIGNKYKLDIVPEILLHEWIPDLTESYTNEEVVRNLRIAKRELENRLRESDLKYISNIESLDNVRKRGLSVLERYCHYNKVIVVSHGVLINSITGIKLHTGEYTTISSDELEERFDFYPKTLKKMF